MENAKYLSHRDDPVENSQDLSLNERRRELEKLKRLATTLDSAVALPGGYRVGLDGFIGLIPVVGDVFTAFISSFIVVRASQLGVGAPHLLRMMLNIAIELVVGVIPVVGDLFDFIWKANQKNMALIERHLPAQSPRRSARRRLSIASGVLIACVLLVLVGLVVAIVKLLIALFTFLF